MRVAGGKVEKVAVELGLRDELAGAVAFRAGVKAGDVLVLGSARGGLAEGAPVELAASPDRAAGRRPPEPTAD
jgi:hypothetical protein